MQQKSPLLLTSLLLCILIFFTWILINKSGTTATNPKVSVDSTKPFYYELQLPDRAIQFNLVDPDQAPENIRDEVKLGWKIMQETQQYAKNYVGNSLTCGNCHFSCGNNFGGKNGSISLVGATTWYPEYSERSKRTETIEDRIDNCFMRSMNGTPPPKDSPEMRALVAYLTWISKQVDSLKKSPWRGLIPLGLAYTPDPIRGKKIYVESCAPCHQMQGEGLIKEDSTLQIPAVFGPQSYNDGAGMNSLPKLSSFVYYNMPYQQPTLTKEEALDVGAFLIEQPRPHFKPPSHTKTDTSTKPKP